MKEIIFISAQPATLFYAWQIEVQIHNFRKFGISNQMHVLFWHLGGDIATECMELTDKYPEVKFFFYEDKGSEVKEYVSVIRPHTLKQHFEILAEELANKTIFYHDCDIIFNFLPKFDLLLGDNIQYLSDTKSYLNYNYLTKKAISGNMPAEKVVNELARISDITTEKIKSEDNNTGGAQYLLKNIDYTFWYEVEKVCIEIHKYLGKINKLYFKSENEGYQRFCSDMWAVQYVLWSNNFETKTTKELEFAWATDLYQVAIEKPIFHNAGVTTNMKHLFNKNEWRTKSPIIDYKDKWGSDLYVEAIRDVKKR